MLEPPQAKPVTKRRRWLVVAIAVLGLMSLGTWGLWPAVDPRLVGEWRMVPDYENAFPPEFSLKVRENGLVDHVVLPYAQGQRGTGAIVQAVGPLRLKVAGDRFELQNEGMAGMLQLVAVVKNLIRGRRPDAMVKARIVSVEAERLVLEFEERGELVFLRVAEGTLGRKDEG